MDAQFLKDQVNFIEGFKNGFLQAINIVAAQYDKEEKEKKLQVTPTNGSQENPS